MRALRLFGTSTVLTISGKGDLQRNEN